MRQIETVREIDKNLLSQSQAFDCIFYMTEGSLKLCFHQCGTWKIVLYIMKYMEFFILVATLVFSSSISVKEKFQGILQRMNSILQYYLQRFWQILTAIRTVYKLNGNLFFFYNWEVERIDPFFKQCLKPIYTFNPRVLYGVEQAM